MGSLGQAPQPMTWVHYFYFHLTLGDFGKLESCKIVCNQVKCFLSRADQAYNQD